MPQVTNASIGERAPGISPEVPGRQPEQGQPVEGNQVQILLNEFGIPEFGDMTINNPHDPNKPMTLTQAGEFCGGGIADSFRTAYNQGYKMAKEFGASDEDAKKRAAGMMIGSIVAGVTEDSRAQAEELAEKAKKKLNPQSL